VNDELDPAATATWDAASTLRAGLLAAQSRRAAARSV